mmetsp:Transcript_17306/g.29545  ORF Transcript_17306/g.29545 Transcript_17306/m.29545 type:complete len:117 (-) Transcript_17306:932-1282(-)
MGGPIMPRGPSMPPEYGGAPMLGVLVDAPGYKLPGPPRGNKLTGSPGGYKLDGPPRGNKLAGKLPPALLVIPRLPVADGPPKTDEGRTVGGDTTTSALGRVHRLLPAWLAPCSPTP